MGLIKRRTMLRLAWGALGALAVLAAVDGWRLWRDERLNAQIASGTLAPESPEDRPELRFAHAYAQAASGATEAALNRYGALHADTPVGQAARYNGANLLMRQGMALRAGAQPGQALALIELAKEGYREVLRHDADDWPARYNLERAQRLVPDPEEVDEEPPEARRSAERAATTMRGYSPGLP
ncbi:MxaK protein [uncultured Piscinibacter sp.]|uniref:MxaK protein n=1 Tax=uncultured Piscinibacter sp. TaxID=1131835 RepID=UPI002625DCF0|nr:MxaK protein [uncultured Piscinibacter sp.]